MARTASIGLRVEPRLLELAKTAAKADRRTVAALMEKLLVEHLEEVGLLPRSTTEHPFADPPDVSCKRRQHENAAT